MYRKAQAIYAKTGIGTSKSKKKDFYIYTLRPLQRTIARCRVWRGAEPQRYVALVIGWIEAMSTRLPNGSELQLL